jgi:hypothetical protein
MNKRIWLLMIVTVIVVSCEPEVYFDVDLEDIAYREGDLPVTGASMHSQEVNAEKDWKYDSWVELQGIKGEAGNHLMVDVILFADRKELLKAYDEFLSGEGRIETGLADYVPPEIGYALVGKKQPLPGGGSEVNLTFQRCYALVNVWARFDPVPAFTEEDLYRYAGVLDKRLNESVCPI